MGKSRSVLAIVLILGLAALPAGCSNNATTTGSTIASATITATGSVATSSGLTTASTLPGTIPTSPMTLPGTMPTSPTTLPPTPSTGSAIPTAEPVRLDLVGAYLVVIDHLIANRNIRTPQFNYLAVDTTKLPDLTPDDKARLFQGLEKYGFQLLDKTFKQLEAEGYIGKSLEFADGAWIDLKDIRMDGPVMTLDAGIHLAGLNAYGLDDMRVSYASTGWAITHIDWTWVA